MPNNIDRIPNSQKIAWSIDDTAKELTVSNRTVQNLIAEGKIRATKIGRRVLIDPESVRAMMSTPPTNE